MVLDEYELVDSRNVEISPIAKLLLGLALVFVWKQRNMFEGNSKQPNPHVPPFAPSPPLPVPINPVYGRLCGLRSELRERRGERVPSVHGGLQAGHVLCGGGVSVAHIDCGCLTCCLPGKGGVLLGSAGGESTCSSIWHNIFLFFVLSMTH